LAGFVVSGVVLRAPLAAFSVWVIFHTGLVRG